MPWSRAIAASSGVSGSSFEFTCGNWGYSIGFNVIFNCDDKSMGLTNISRDDTFGSNGVLSRDSKRPWPQYYLTEAKSLSFAFPWRSKMAAHARSRRTQVAARVSAWIISIHGVRIMSERGDNDCANDADRFDDAVDPRVQVNTLLSHAENSTWVRFGGCDWKPYWHFSGLTREPYFDIIGKKKKTFNAINFLPSLSWRSFIVLRLNWNDSTPPPTISTNWKLIWMWVHVLFLKC